MATSPRDRAISPDTDISGALGGLPSIIEKLFIQLATEYHSLLKENNNLQEEIRQLRPYGAPTYGHVRSGDTYRDGCQSNCFSASTSSMPCNDRQALSHLKEQIVSFSMVPNHFSPSRNPSIVGMQSDSHSHPSSSPPGGTTPNSMRSRRASRHTLRPGLSRTYSNIGQRLPTSLEQLKSIDDCSSKNSSLNFSNPNEQMSQKPTLSCPDTVEEGIREKGSKRAAGSKCLRRSHTAPCDSSDGMQASLSVVKEADKLAITQNSSYSGERSGERNMLHNISGNGFAGLINRIGIPASLLKTKSTQSFSQLMSTEIVSVAPNKVIDDSRWRPRIPNYFCQQPSHANVPRASFTMMNMELLKAQQRTYYIISPIGIVRLCWDIALCLCVLLDFWVTLFSIAFLSSRPPTGILVVAYSLIGFFCIDIIVNMRTAYIEDGLLVMDRHLIVGRYLRYWFWMDLVATVPWSAFLPEVTGLISLARILKLPTMTSFGSLWTIRSLRHYHRTTPLVIGVVVIFVVLMLLAHIHACFWALARSAEGLAGAEHTDFDEALRYYHEGFWWSFTAFAYGSNSAKFPWLRNLEVLISCERSLLLTLILVWGSFQIVVFYRDAVNVVCRTEHTLNYMRDHKVSALTQLQVACTIYQVTKGQKSREYFYDSVKLLPTELRQAISAEMWQDALLSLGLIEQVARWHEDFLMQLLFLVGEDIVPSQATLCVEGEPMMKAWKIRSGKLAIESTVSDDMPDLLEGMWVGEHALVNPHLLSSGTVSVKQSGVLMSLPVQDFHHLLHELGLSNQFKEECAAQLWRGLCGRCGALGDHFPPECPTIQLTKARSRIFTDLGQNGFSARFSLKKTPVTELWPRKPATLMQRDLKEFLYCTHLEELVPVMTKMNIKSLEQLETLLGSEDDELKGELGASKTNILTTSSIIEFRKRAAAEIREQMEFSGSSKKYLMFLSHYKVEAGTEAALMRSELQAVIDRDPRQLGRQFEVPIFLDSEDLNDLDTLQKNVIDSQNLILLLTKGVLLRPWVLVEILTAATNGVPIIPLRIVKPEVEFEFPDDAFYGKLRNGEFLDQDAMRVLKECDIDLQALEDALRVVFKHIAMPYSPHRAANIRQAELESLMRDITQKQYKSFSACRDT